GEGSHGSNLNGNYAPTRVSSGWKSTGYEVKRAPVPFGDPGEEGFATIEKNREKFSIEGFRNADIFVLPTFSSRIPRVSEAMIDPSQGLSAEQTAFANYYGLPAICVPVGVDSYGMPIGLQLVTHSGGDAQLLGLAQQVEQSAGFAMQLPRIQKDS
ncbi:amidase family protein, partial [uncultured Paracoccus sp.]|uniref:amidase family protein n=1 Tax=uncultured Paracoccus sp. TaxID=189685 RepID=UPI002633716C